MRTMEDKMTGWFSAIDNRPVHQGVYLVQNIWGHECFSYWDGSKWSRGEDTPDAAARSAGLAAPGDRVRWRGLAQPA